MKEKKAKNKSPQNLGALGTANYPVGDFLIRVKNAALAGRKKVECKNTNLVRGVAEVLKKKNFLDEITKEDGKLSVTLTFHKKRPAIFGIKLISKPGLRIYMGVGEIEKKKGASFYIISTPMGVMASGEAIRKRAGGEVLAEVW